MTTETFWLIELPSASKPLYICAGEGQVLGWTRNTMQAFQWGIKAQAQDVLDSFSELPQGVQKHEVIVSEHEWL